MITVFIAARHKLDYYKEKVCAGLVDVMKVCNKNRVETELDTWIFIEPTKHWENKLIKGNLIDRIYICRNTVKYTDSVQQALILALRCFKKGVVIF